MILEYRLPDRAEQNYLVAVLTVRTAERLAEDLEQRTGRLEPVETEVSHSVRQTAAPLETAMAEQNHPRQEQAPEQMPIVVAEYTQMTAGTPDWNLQEPAD